MNNIAARMNYDNARKTLIKLNAGDPTFDVRRYKLTQSYLRLEVLLATGTSQYQYRVLVNDSNPQIFNTERRLNLQDTFIPSEVGFFLGFPTSATDDTYKLLSYPSPFLVTNDAQYFRLYNGSLSITVNNNVLVPSWDMWRHYAALQTQQTAALGAGSPMDEFDGRVTGFYPMEPNVALIGSKQIQIFHTLVNGMTAVDEFSRAILVFRGILAQNSTVVS
jgi:hypothetical protein